LIRFAKCQQVVSGRQCIVMLIVTLFARLAGPDAYSPVMLKV
jgi:hypothetical protein